MASDINKVFLIGNMVRDPELRSTPTGSYLCRFTLASNRDIYVKDGENKKEVGYFDCLVWGGRAEVMSKYGVKGKRVAVDGSLKFSSWDNADGKKQSKVEILVENFQFLDSKKSGESPETEPFNDSSIPF